MSHIPASGWYVEIDAAGHTHTPAVKGEPTRNPRLYGQPTLELPVADDDKWFHTAFEEAPMRVWKDGIRQPVDTLVTPTATENGVTLTGRGGDELLTRVQREVSVAPAHEVARDLIQNNTTYTANVDTYQPSTQTNESLYGADTTSELESRLLNALNPSDPLETTSTGELQPTQTCWTAEGEDATGGSFTQYFRTDYSGSTDSNDNAPAAALESTSEYAYWDFTPSHDIPEEDLGLHIREETPGSETPEVVYKFGIAGNSLQEIDRLSYSGSISRLSLSWKDHQANPFDGGNGWTGGDLSAGTTYRLRVDIAQSANDPIAIDVVAPADNRYSYFFDNTVTTSGSGNILDGPEWYPDAVERQFEDAETVYSVSGGRVEATIDDTSNQQALALSNDFGDTWSTTSNTGTFETDFADLGPSLRFRVTLSRYGSQSQTPATGINPQSLDAFDLFGDLDDTPLLVRRQFDGALKDVLRTIAREVDAVWEFRRTGNAESIEWTYPGYRTAGETPSVVQFEASSTTEGTYQKAVIKGGAQQVREESFTANHGTAEPLNQANLQPGKEVVYDPTDGTEFVATEDYEIDVSAGNITTLADGSMMDGSEHAITYWWQPEQSFTAEGATDPKVLVRTIPPLTTTRGCGQAALRLVQTLQDPLQSGTATVPTDEAEWSVVEELTLDALPVAGMQINEVRSRPEATELVLGSRESPQEALASIRTSIQQLEDRS